MISPTADLLSQSERTSANLARKERSRHALSSETDSQKPSALSMKGGDAPPSYSRAVSAGGSRPPSQSRLEKESSVDPVKAPSRFQRGQRVVFYDTKGCKHCGTVRWTGREGQTRKFEYSVVGIQTVSLYLSAGIINYDIYVLG